MKEIRSGLARISARPIPQHLGAGHLSSYQAVSPLLVLSRLAHCEPCARIFSRRLTAARAPLSARCVCWLYIYIYMVTVAEPVWQRVAKQGWPKFRICLVRSCPTPPDARPHHTSLPQRCPTSVCCCCCCCGPVASLDYTDDGWCGGAEVRRCGGEMRTLRCLAPPYCERAPALRNRRGAPSLTARGSMNSWYYYMSPHKSACG